MHSQKITRTFNVNTFTGFLLLLLLPLDSKPLAAQPDCEKLYTQLSTKLDTVITDKNRELQITRLHALEDELFKGFESCPENPLLFTLMGEVQISLNNIGLAVLYARKAMTFDGAYWQTYHLLGNSLCMIEQYEEGLLHLEKASNLAPGKPELEFNLCSSYLAANKLNQAIAACSQLLARKDHQLHGPAYFIRGTAYELLDETTKAQQDFNKANSLGYSPN